MPEACLPVGRDLCANITSSAPRPPTVPKRAFVILSASDAFAFADGVRAFVFADRVRFAAALRRLKDIAAPRHSN